MPKILFIGAHRFNRSPSQRFRFEQYFSFLEENGFVCHLSSLLKEGEDHIFYGSGSVFMKTWIVLCSFFRRIKDVSKSREYDIVFIQREAFMTGTTLFERILKAAGKKIVFDFDDAIWLSNISEGNKRFEWMKNSSKTSHLIAMADKVIAGNDYLGDYGRKFNSNVSIIPTTIDTAYHKRIGEKKVVSRICIGWTGSHTTIAHFEHAIPVLNMLKKKFGDRIYFKVIGDSLYKNDELGIKGIPWKYETEILDLAEIDIGIMPLPDNDWTKGKCGLKGLQYMALEIPSVMSNVGVNSQIVTDSLDGFLVNNDGDWIDKISMLIEDPELRKRIGTAARKTVEDRYSVDSQKEKFLSCLNSLL